MIDEPNGNNVLNVKLTSNSSVIPITSSQSTDDLSQSLSVSEYTDADESMSAPTEFLAEFLSAVMLKDYRKALKYCKLILDFEPNNITAKEFYPLIEEKLRLIDEKSSSDDDNYNNLSSPDDEVDAIINRPVFNIGDVDGPVTDDRYSNDSDSDYSIDSDSESDEIDDDSNNRSNGSFTASESENTTHSYSNSLLEDEDDKSNMDEEEEFCESNDNALVNNQNTLHRIKMDNELQSPDLSDLNNGNYKMISCSDSESPSEPLTQKIAAIFRSSFSSVNETK